VGIGGARVDVEVENVAGIPIGEIEDDTVFAYQAVLGTSFEIMEGK